MSTQLSPDGLYFWDGRQWLSTLSHDGRNRWNGTAWVPVLVLLGLGAISLPLDLLNAVTGSAVSAASGFSLPSWTYWLGFVISIPGTALFAWMLIALVQRGPWGMKKVAPSVI